MARMRFRRSYQFDSATRQLDSRDLDEAGDPTTDMGAAMEALLAQYGALDLQPAYPGYDIMEGSISGPLSQLGDDYGTLAAAMDRASGYEEYPATLPALGTWDAPSDYAVRWTPNAPGIYQWYAMSRVDFDVTVAAATIVSFSPMLPDIIASSWGGDNASQEPIDLSATTYQSTSQGMLLASQEMLDAGYGGLQIRSPHYQLQGPEVVDANYLFLAVMSWSPAGTVAYMGGI